MPLEISQSRSTVLVRREAFERAGLQRSAIDKRYNLTDLEFNVEGDLIAIGPLPADELASDMIADLEIAGLAYFEDFFELSGNWPEWLRLYARA